MHDFVIELEGSAPARVLVPADDVTMALQLTAVAIAPPPEPGEEERTSRIRITGGGGDSVWTVLKRREGAMKLNADKQIRRGAKAVLKGVTPFAKMVDWKCFDPLVTPQGRLDRIHEAMGLETGAEEKLQIIKAALEGVEPGGPSHLTPIHKWTPGIWLIVGGMATHIRTMEADDAIEGAAAVLETTVAAFATDAISLLHLILPKLDRVEGGRDLKQTIYTFRDGLLKLKNERGPAGKAYGRVYRAAVAFIGAWKSVASVTAKGPKESVARFVDTQRDLGKAVGEASLFFRGPDHGGISVQGKPDNPGGRGGDPADAVSQGGDAGGDSQGAGDRVPQT